MSRYQPVGGKLFTLPFFILSIFAAIALYLLVERFIFGLGAITNINNGYAWGIWIAFDVIVGTAFGCGGFVIAMLVYIFNRGEYHPLIRPAVMASLFGYTLGGMAVLFDLGRWWQVYNVFLPWYSQLNSAMLEVSLCVTAYIVVLWIEFTPVFLERFGIHQLRKKLNKLLFVFVAIGVLLPTMHQSSLGTMMISMGFKLYPLWSTTWLPLLFLMTAILTGYAIVVFEALFSSAGFRRPYDTEILNKISNLIWMLTVLYLVIRFADLLSRDALGLVMKWDINAVMFIIENLLFIVPIVILAKPNNRQQPRLLFIGAFCMLLATTLYRVNTYLIGFNPGGGWSYFPSVTEILVTVGIFSLEILLYLIFVKTLPVLHEPKHV